VQSGQLQVSDQDTNLSLQGKYRAAHLASVFGQGHTPPPANGKLYYNTPDHIFAMEEKACALLAKLLTR
jgi:hypothetical protein